MKEVESYLASFWPTACSDFSPALFMPEFAPSLFSMVLTVNAENFDYVKNLPPFQEAYELIFKEEPTTQEAMCCAQKALLAYLLCDATMWQETLACLDALHKAAILPQKQQEALHQLPLHVEPSLPAFSLDMPVAEGFDFHGQKEALLKVAHTLFHELLESQSLKETCQSVIQRLGDTAFSIGITGVMNAGKSTFLNALLKQEILGTSTVPETANLAIIKHASTPQAIVHFWNAAEWESIEQSAQNSESMARFVETTKARFGAEWATLVRPEGVSQTIPLETLGQFTSAKLSEGKCNLVKCVELYTDVALAQEGVSIVDTPGLDDPVVQREEITKQYLVQCDVMIHLMNASQSATKKDVDFIIDALTYQRISRLVILITRVDMLSSAELEEVMEYTTRSITNQLKALGKAQLIEPILKKIAIFPVAGELALWHRTGRVKEALARGYDEEQTGILAIERYLHEVLFGKENERATLAIGANTKALRLACEQQHTQYGEHLARLDVSVEELEARYEALKEQNLRANLERLLEELARLKGEFEAYLATMKQFASSRFATLRAELLRRLASDITYTLRKESRFPKSERLEMMVYTAVKDGLMDTLREYRFALYRHMNAQSESLSVEYATVCAIEPLAFDPKAYIDEAAKKGLLSADNSLLSDALCGLVARASKKQTEALFEAMEKTIATFFEQLEHKSMPRLYEVGSEMVAQFYAQTQAPAQEARAQIDEEEKALKEALALALSEQKTLDVRKQELRQKRAALEEVMAYFDGVRP